MADGSAMPLGICPKKPTAGANCEFRHKKAKPMPNTPFNFFV
jgi:hypothetical protein